jgi:class 3 adenylate cyclase/tetratricopeptide (TPR) repeat protein
VPGAKFCAECGFALGSATTSPLTTRREPGPVRGDAPARRPADAERRLVSVLFADLVGFTALAEGRDAEETRELLSRYFALATDVIGRYGGTIEKFIGDAVMAVWGAPVAHEDDAERSVRAALDLVDAVRSLGPGIQARAGVLTGEAAVTLDAVNQGLVAGDLVNTASRLQSVAPPGSVLVGETTQRASAAAITFERAGDQLLKGKEAPVTAWRAVRVVAEVGGRNRSDALEAPFVGRDTELRLLRDLYHSSARERRVRLVSLIGPAGIGKSRLAWEFLKYIDGLLDNVWWHSGRSPAHGGGLTFWALGEMVRGRCGLVEGDTEATTRARVAETLAQHLPDVDERRWLEPALLALLGVGGAPTRSEELFGAWRTFFERLAATSPVVMVFEDLHWADLGTLDFIDHLLDWSRGLPIYVVTLARPELLEQRPGWGAGKRDFTSLSLDPLPEPAMRQLLAGLVPDLPEPAVRAIVARADGIPLYAVETVRMLLGEGRLELRDGAYHPVGDMVSLSVPETLTALISARLDALDPDDRALVQDAAVLGLSFTLAALAAVTDREVAELEPRLRTLVRRELFRLDNDPRSAERGQFIFVQALIREVAYNTLARRDRKTRHLAAARYFEGAGGDELAAALAAHYLAAHANAPAGPEADALAAQARLALTGAAERAAALGANDQAAALLEQALTVTSDLADEAALHQRAGEAAMAGGRYEAAEGHLQRAIDIHRAAGDRATTARVVGQLGLVLTRARQNERALEVLEAGATEFEDLYPAPAVLSLLGYLAGACSRMGQDRRALELSERVLEPAELADETETVALVLLTRGCSLSNIGRTYEGLALIEASARLAEANGLQDTVLVALGNKGAYLGGDPRAALEAERAGLALARRLGRRAGIVTNTANACEDAMRTGEWDWAVSAIDSLLAEELTDAERAGLMGTRIAYRACRGEDVADDIAFIEQRVAVAGGRLPESELADARAAIEFASGDLRRAARLWREMATLSAINAPYVLPRAARASLWVGDADAVVEDLAAFEATGIHGPASLAARVTIRAGLAALAGRSSEAESLYREAIRQWRDLGLPWDIALTILDMVLVLGPDLPGAGESIAEARTILEGLRARAMLARLDAAVGTARGGPATTPQPRMGANVAS